MDPITIAITIATLAQQCFGVAKVLGDIRDKMSHAQLLISAVSSETFVINAALSKLQSMLISDQYILGKALQTNPDMGRACEAAMTGCTMLFSRLEDEVGALSKSFEGSEKLGFRQRMKLVWKDDVMKELLQHIRGQAIALNLLLQCFQTHASADIRQLLESQTQAMHRITSSNHLHSTLEQEQKTSMIPTPGKFSREAGEMLLSALMIRSVNVRNEVELLLNNGADLSLADSSGQTALHLAVRLDRIDVVRRLLNAGASVTARSRTGHTALGYASMRGFHPIISAILDREVAIGPVNGATPLHLAAYRGDLITARRLLKDRADPNARDNSDATPLHFAGQTSNERMVLLLLENGADMNLKSRYWGKPLHQAAFQGMATAVKAMLVKGADPNEEKRPGCGFQPLYLATIGGYNRVVEVLLSHGANPNATVHPGSTYTSLQFAVEHGNTELERLLREWDQPR